ncbi:unnamed protein product [Durusdinium trenchii]|uniref:Uncharacterized protein n=1 Tax=Durusdinium trenchii TaxID=1381693 RepID=A0ABP0RK05_9DINO
MSLPRAQDFDLFDELDRMRPRLSFKVEDDDLENYQVHQASTIFDFLTSKVERTNIQSFLELKDKPEDGRRRASTCSTCATLAEVPRLSPSPKILEEGPLHPSIRIRGVA